MNKGRITYFAFMAILLLIASCSTTKVIPDGSYRLKENILEVTNSDQYPQYKDSELKNYIRQKPNTYFIGQWNPFLYIYNWSNGKNNGWDKFVKKLGQAPVVFDKNMVNASNDNLETHLKYVGFYNSTITNSIKTKNKKATVKYNVTLGKQYIIDDIKFVILDPILDSIYMADTLNCMVKKGMPLSEQILDAESERAATIFRENGYYDFSKNYFFFTADTLTNKGKASLEIRVNNYTRNELESNARPHRQSYIGNVTIYPVSDVYKYRAGLSKKIEPKLDTLKYDNLTILYDNKLKIRPSVLKRMNRVVPGSLYKESVITNTYQRFSNLRLYSSVNVSMNQVTPDTVDCNIRLVPTKTQGYKLNLEASTNSTGLIGISPAISYYNKNIFRGGEWLNLSLMGNFQFAVRDTARSNEFGASVGISFPTFLFLPDKMFNKLVPRTDLNVAYNFQQRPEYTRNMITALFGYNWTSLSKQWVFQVNPARINIVKMSNLSPSFYEMIQDPFVRDSYIDHFDFGGGTNIGFYSDPSINPKHTNYKATFKFDIAGNLLSAFNSLMPADESGNRTIWGSPYAQYVRGEFAYMHTWKFGKRERIAIATRALAGVGFAYGNSNALPFEQLFWVGGSNSMRGWQTRSLGPGKSPLDTSLSIPNQTGDMRIEANLEFRFPMFWLLNGALFFDAGNVWQKREITDFRNFAEGIAFNTGLGLRLDIQFVVIRFDWGIKLKDPSQHEWAKFGEWFKRGGSAFQFGIGYPF